MGRKWMPAPLAPHKCSRCGNKFELPGPPVPGMKVFCMGCTKIVIDCRDHQTDINKEVFSLEQRNEEISRQINGILTKEASGISEESEESLKDLIERKKKNEEKIKKLTKEFEKLQKKKMKS